MFEFIVAAIGWGVAGYFFTAYRDLRKRVDK